MNNPQSIVVGFDDPHLQLAEVPPNAEAVAEAKQTIADMRQENQMLLYPSQEVLATALAAGLLVKTPLPEDLKALIAKSEALETEYKSLRKQFHEATDAMHKAVQALGYAHPYVLVHDDKAPDSPALIYHLAPETESTPA